MKHGFKSWCERAAISYRNNLGLKNIDPLPANTLAQHLGVILKTPEEIDGLSKESLEVLLNGESKSWSAVTLTFGTKNVVIYNPKHSAGRRSNDIMHELSHIIIGHQPQQMHSYELALLLRHYNAEQEDEADWLAATLLLPKDILIKIKASRIDHEDAARVYGTSKALVEMRMNVAGVNHIFLRAARTK